MRDNQARANIKRVASRQPYREDPKFYRKAELLTWLIHYVNLFKRTWS